ncbi:hypothetical protein C8J56DRAFT_1120379 [Mycena floridula]|nr:hypothetical protein C8J56DRAFT_1120379 [Mycena floridula]
MEHKKRYSMLLLVILTVFLLGKTGPLLAFPNHLALAKGFNSCWVELPSPKFIVGDLELFASVAQVESVRIPGYLWWRQGRRRNPREPGEKVLYHRVHGGGYVLDVNGDYVLWLQSGCPSDMASQIAHGLIIMKHIPNIHRTFSLGHRLSISSPYPATNPFPATLIDTTTDYIHLVKVVGYSPDDIIIEGASSVCRWQPCFSSYKQALANSKSDYIRNTTDGSEEYSKGSFTGPHVLGAAQVNRYISPTSLHPQMNISFKGFPRPFIVAREAEIRMLKDKMMDKLGKGNGVNDDGKVIYYEAVDAIHDYVVFRGFELQRTETLKAIATWFSGK